ncbi:beta-Ala-His dipeptidase isoform X1 [Corvus cornix cornix]|uniref:beta-Ala-His dipeptidase isoform X1 n=3 Tax=Corvus cornix cornix TaxID=932674 RepID=UPI00194DF245|nr:beta-Ala-His dipeptidase isoform X1 [Corvus cornix cornix]
MESERRQCEELHEQSAAWSFARNQDKKRKIPAPQHTSSVKASSPFVILTLKDSIHFSPVLLSKAAMSRSSSSALEMEIFQYIDAHQSDFIKDLKEWVAVESDSVQPHLRKEVIRMMALAADRLAALGATVHLVNLGSHQLPDGQVLPLPSVILGELGKDPQNPTVCFYGHVDVQPAKKEDGWNSDPYTLTEIDGNLYGRGATDNKGPVLAWINAVETFRALKLAMPVNFKFVIEGMEEAGSLGLEKLLEEENQSFFSDVDYIVISDNLWLSNKKPALTYGSRGNACFFVEVECGSKDLHSGTFGGIIHEPLLDLIALLDSLVDSTGRIQIPGIYDSVAALTEEERKLYESIEFDLEEHRINCGVKKFLYSTKEEILLHLWRYPSLSVHGIEGAFHEPGIKTVIPAKVIGKFSIRQVPHMDLSVVKKQVVEHLEGVFSKRNSPNKLKVSMPLGAKPWLADVNDLLYKAARRAIKTVFGEDPDFIRDGSTVPIARMFQTITQKSVMMLPIGAADDGEHSQNEKISRHNYIEGTKLFAAFFLEISKLHQTLHETSHRETIN